MRQRGDQPQQRHRAPAPALDLPQDLSEALAAPGVDRTRTEIAREKEPPGRAGDAANLGPDDPPGNAEEDTSSDRQRGARYEQQAGDDMDSEKRHRRCRIAADRGGNFNGVDNRPPMPSQGNTDR